MSEPVSAAIHIRGATIRCAEVVRRGATLDLRRFGHRSFEFDLTRVLWGEEEVPSALDRVGAAIRKQFEGTKASEACVVFHPLDVYSFFTPISGGLSERDRMHHVIQHAALLTGARSPDSLRITPQSVRTSDREEGDSIDWVHVLAVPRAVKERVETLVNALPVQEHDQMVTSEAAARLTGISEKQAASAPERDPARPYSLAVGHYPTHTEYALTRDRVWHHAHATEEARTPANRAYYAVGFLNRIGVSQQEVGRLFVYGTRLDRNAFGPFENLFECQAELLDPFQVLHRFPDRPPEEVVGAYVPCIGAALGVFSR